MKHIGHRVDAENSRLQKRLKVQSRSTCGRIDIGPGKSAALQVLVLHNILYDCIEVVCVSKSSISLAEATERMK